MLGNRLKGVVSGLGAAAAYYLAAKFGLAFALPAGYASLIWPATAVALLLTVRRPVSGSIGSALGAFLANISSDPGQEFAGFDRSAVAPIAVVALSVLLQSRLGEFLIRRFARRMPDESTILRLVGVAIAITIPTALVRAIGETSALFGFHLVSDASRANVALTIGLGDFMAALSVYPIIMLAGTLPLIRLRADRTFRMISIAQMAVMIGGWAIAGFLAARDDAGLQDAFSAQSAELVALIKLRTADDRLFLNTLRSLNEADHQLSRTEFADFSSIILASQPQINLTALIRRVRPEERASYEQSRSPEAGHEFSISYLQNGKLNAEPSRPGDYFPLDYVEPAAIGREIEGFDMVSDDDRKAVLQRAAVTDLPAVSPLLHRLNRDQPTRAIMATLPFHDHPGQTAVDSIRGFVLLRTDLDHWVDLLLQRSGSLMRLATVSIDDLTGPAEYNMVRIVAGEPFPGIPAAPARGYARSEDFEMEGRRWRVSIGIPPPFLNSLRDAGFIGRQIVPQLLAFLIAGLLSMATRQRRSRDRFDAQVGALSRQFLLNVNGPSRGQLATTSRIDTPAPASIEDGLDARCTAIWDARLTEQYFQPIVNLKSGALMGFESLLRIPTQPQAMSVCDFITWAEGAGQIKTITRESIEEALVNIERLQALTGRKSVPWISVNVSASDLGDPEFVDSVVALVRFHPEARTYLKLEITESVLLSNIETTAERLALLRATGLHIALDDFGTGYASLSYLRQLPIDTLKIDRSFITPVMIDPTAREIVDSLITLARKLSVDVIAEGIEDDATAAAVLRLGCTQGQGYRFAKACPFDTVSAWVKEGRRFKAA